MADITYFIAYRYQQGDYTIDGNTVLSLARPIKDEADVRQVESMIAREKGVPARDFGLTNLVRLD